MNSHRAKSKLNALTSAYPNLNQIVDMMAFGERPKHEPEWPNSVLLPSNAWMGISAFLLNLDATSISIQANLRTQVATLSKEARFLATWSKTQGIYRFDPTIYKELLDAPMTGEIPSSVLLSMPEWCMYLETPGLKLFPHVSIRGCWVMNEFVTDNKDRQEMDFSLMLDLDATVNGQQVATTAHFNVPLGTQQSLEEVLATIESKAITECSVMLAKEIGDVIPMLRSAIGSVMSLALYVCTQSDFRSAKDWGMPTNPQPQHKKGATRLFSPSTPQMWEVGVRMGSAIRKVLESSNTEYEVNGGSGSTMRPHIRRAHWHGFRVGKAKDDSGERIPAEKRDMAVKFLPSIPVNLPENMKPEDLPAVIHPVR